MLRRKRLKKIIIIIVSLLFVIWVAASNILVDVALIPEKMQSLDAFEDITEESLEALVQTSDIEKNRAKAIEETNTWLESVDAEKWSVVTEEGYKLVGVAFYQKSPAHKWALLLHGYTGWKEELYPLACEYAKRGYQVLVPDMRCSGESEGDFIGMGWTDRRDNMRWLDKILEKDPQAEIVLHGQSMGGACALMMAGENLPDNVVAAIADSAYTDAYDMFKKQLWDWFHIPSFPLLNGANLMLQVRGGYNLKEASALEAVKHSKIPILIIHGAEDQFVPAEMAQDLYDAAAGEKELLVMQGAGHAQAPDKDPDKYYGTVFDFLK